MLEFAVGYFKEAYLSNHLKPRDWIIKIIISLIRHVVNV